MTTPEENDDLFKKIVEGAAETEGSDSIDPTKVTSLWDAMVKLWRYGYPGMLTKAVIVAEYAIPNGRGIQVLTSPGMTDWEGLGMLKFAMLHEEAMALSLPSDGEDEDDD